MEICITLFDSNHNDWIMVCHAFQYTNVFDIVDRSVIVRDEIKSLKEMESKKKNKLPIIMAHMLLARILRPLNMDKRDINLNLSLNVSI